VGKAADGFGVRSSPASARSGVDGRPARSPAAGESRRPLARLLAALGDLAGGMDRMAIGGRRRGAWVAWSYPQAQGDAPCGLF
jgi:hypothetical protein